MKALPLQVFERTLRRPIGNISHKWMTDACHMHANLMSAPGLQLALNKSVCTKTFQHLIVPLLQVFRFCN